MAEILHLVRWAEPQVDPGLPPYLSTVVRTAYDCTGKKERYLASTSYAGNLGNGATVVADEDAAEGWSSISEDSMEEKIWSLAYFDFLTNLPNRRMLLDRLGQALLRAKRYQNSP